MPRAVRFARDESLRVGEARSGGSSDADQGFNLGEIAAVSPNRGSPRIHVLLRREGSRVNHRRTERLYRLEGLNLMRNRPRRRKSVVTRGPVVVPTGRDERWSMDFMHDQLQDGQRIRVLTVVDQYTREALVTEAHGSFSAHDVTDVLNRLSRSHRKPAVIQVDNGTEFASRVLHELAYREDVRLDFSRPRKPTDNARIESFNARLRADCLNAHAFESLEDAEETLTSWRSDYNAARPHGALGMLAPREPAELGQRNAGRSWPEFLAARVASTRGKEQCAGDQNPDWYGLSGEGHL
jgi:putative transposase